MVGTSRNNTLQLGVIQGQATQGRGISRDHFCAWPRLNWFRTVRISAWAVGPSGWQTRLSSHQFRQSPSGILCVKSEMFGPYQAYYAKDVLVPCSFCCCENSFICWNALLRVLSLNPGALKTSSAICDFNLRNNPILAVVEAAVSGWAQSQLPWLAPWNCAGAVSTTEELLILRIVSCSYATFGSLQWMFWSVKESHTSQREKTPESSTGFVALYASSKDRAMKKNHRFNLCWLNLRWV